MNSLQESTVGVKLRMHSGMKRFPDSAHGRSYNLAGSHDNQGEVMTTREKLLAPEASVGGRLGSSQTGQRLVTDTA